MRNKFFVLLTVGFVCMIAATAEAQRAGRSKTKEVSRGREMMRATYMKSVDDYNRGIAESYLEVEKMRLEAEKYTGTVVKPHPSATGARARVQQQAATAIEKSGIVPAARVERFRWLPEQQGAKITGWDAQILETERGPVGLLVKIRVTPLHAGYGGFRNTDYMIETYLIAGRHVEHLTSDAPQFGGIVTFN